VWSVLSYSKMLKNGRWFRFYKTGIRLTNTMTDTATQLITYINPKNRRDPVEKRLLGVRFRVQQTEGAEIVFFDNSTYFRAQRPETACYSIGAKLHTKKSLVCFHLLLYGLPAIARGKKL
jgi:hypothetical protein